MVIKRPVSRQMMESIRIKYVPMVRPTIHRATLHGLFSNCMIRSGFGTYLSEGLRVLPGCAVSGGKVFVDLECRLQHRSKTGFRGETWRRVYGCRGVGPCIGRGDTLEDAARQKRQTNTGKTRRCGRDSYYSTVAAAKGDLYYKGPPHRRGAHPSGRPPPSGAG